MHNHGQYFLEHVLTDVVATGGWQAHKVEVRAAPSPEDLTPFFDAVIQLLFFGLLAATVIGGPGGGEGVGGAAQEKVQRVRARQR